MKIFNKKNGFTYVELIAVLSIFSAVTSVVVVNYYDNVMKKRGEEDAKMISLLSEKIIDREDYLLYQNNPMIVGSNKNKEVFVKSEIQKGYSGITRSMFDHILDGATYGSKFYKLKAKNNITSFVSSKDYFDIGYSTKANVKYCLSYIKVAKKDYFFSAKHSSKTIKLKDASVENIANFCLSNPNEITLRYCSQNPSANCG